MKVHTKQFVRIACMVAIIGSALQASLRGDNPLRAANGGGKIEFRRAEYAGTSRPTIADFTAEEFHGVAYRVAKTPELKLTRADVAEVVIHETEPGEFGLQLTMEHSLWTAIESITTASVGGQMAVLVDGNVVFVGVVREPLRDGRLLMSFRGRTKQEVLDLARRFSSTPGFMPLGGTSVK